MLKSWFSAGVLLVGLGVLPGCGDGAQSDDLGGSEDNLKGPGAKAPDVKKDPEAAAPEAPAPGKDEDKPGDASACAALLCPVGTRCEVQEVQCIRAPCPPIASCVPIEEAPANPTCAVTLCKEGTTCVEGPKGAECIPQTPRPTCAVTLCKQGTTCIEGPNGAECVPQEPTTHACAAVLCAAGTECIETPKGPQCVAQKCTAKCSANQHCELQEVQCIRAPCPPIPTCVDNVDACATVRCKSGTHCEVETVQCLIAPCPEHAACVPN